jgi:hypothetical protein
MICPDCGKIPEYNKDAGAYYICYCSEEEEE